MSIDQFSIESQCFISYTRADNDQFHQVVDRLKSDLEGRFAAATGRSLKIFLDRESIGWGEDWRAKIRGSIESATFFIPIVTMRYFLSEPCREELLAFYENAKQLGVTELILPAILTGASKISAEDPREEVQIIEKLNFRNIENEWLEGYDSPAWKKMIHRMVADLESAMVRSEAAMAEREQSAANRLESEEAGELPEEEPDLFVLNETFERITKLTTESGAALNDFAAASSRALEGDMAALSPAQQQARMVKAAGEIKGYASKLSDVATRFEKETVGADAQLRAFVQEARTINHDLVREALGNLLDPLKSIDDMSETLDTIDSIVGVLQFASLANISLRKAVQPGIKGVKSLRNALQTAQSWKKL
ncbi:toll/interleukin-1 receptor domain-containing protein [Sinomonas humi]|uniref:TIR domain-containing protein n=1 Tax=Sinomonas humi TaxID=1338436 RepID=A0A0B2ABK7_9MICC|nr:toll/interleukin-1 receptor domain-containing protein [Sinomonas humi]KHL00945.1 hypothetical protein LK10_18250 [Sinomonas humi]